MRKKTKLNLMLIKNIMNINMNIDMNNNNMNIDMNNNNMNINKNNYIYFNIYNRIFNIYNTILNYLLYNFQNITRSINLINFLYIYEYISNNISNNILINDNNDNNDNDNDIKLPSPVLSWTSLWIIFPTINAYNHPLTPFIILTSFISIWCWRLPHKRLIYDYISAKILYILLINYSHSYKGPIITGLAYILSYIFTYFKFKYNIFMHLLFRYIGFWWTYCILLDIPCINTIILFTICYTFSCYIFSSNTFSNKIEIM